MLTHRAKQTSAVVMGVATKGFPGDCGMGLQLFNS